MTFRGLTDLVKHLVALVENKGLDITERELLVTDQSVQTTGRRDDDVGVGLRARQNLDILLDGSTTVENRGLDIGQVLGETGVLVLDLVGQLASVAHHEDGALAGNGLQLVEGGQDEDRGLTETRLGLAENVDVQNRSRNADLLDCEDAERWLDLIRLKME